MRVREDRCGIVAGEIGAVDRVAVAGRALEEVDVQRRRAAGLRDRRGGAGAEALHVAYAHRVLGVVAPRPGESHADSPTRRFPWEGRGRHEQRRAPWTEEGWMA